LYSAGQIYDGLGRKSDAIRLLVRAGEIDSRYLTRGYYHRELGGLHFEQFSYDLAAEHYRRAIDLGGPEETPYLLSDTLMYGGHFKEASEVAFDAVSIPEFYRSSAIIQQIVIRRVMSMIGVDKQVRVPVASEKLADEHLLGSVDDVVSMLRSSDALDPRLWFRCIFLLGEDIGALECALIAAYVLEGEPKIWILALLLSLRVDGGEASSTDICRLAFRHCSGDQLLEELEEAEFLEPADKDNVRDEILAFTELPRLRLPRVVRFHDRDGTTSVYNVNEEEDREMLAAAKYVSGLSDKEIAMLVKRMESA
jgi:tetratricopeptide (TPR) repeat protein